MGFGGLGLGLGIGMDAPARALGGRTAWPCPTLTNTHLTPSTPQPVLRIKPTDCANPVCVPGPGEPCTSVVCEPEENPIFFQIEMWTIIIFTVDYLLRVLTVHAVPVE